MVRKAFIVALLFVGTPAHAQTTNCQWMGAIFSCTQTPQPTLLPPPPININPPLPPPPPVDYSRLQNPGNAGASFMDGLNQARDRRQQEEFRQAQIALAEEQRAYLESQRANQSAEAAAKQIVPQTAFVAPLETRQAIGQMLRDGNCELALDTALTSGDIQLAINVKDFCQGATVLTNE